MGLRAEAPCVGVYNVADGLDAFTLSVLSLFAGDETSITWLIFF